MNCFVAGRSNYARDENKRQLPTKCKVNQLPTLHLARDLANVFTSNFQFWPKLFLRLPAVLSFLIRYVFQSHTCSLRDTGGNFERGESGIGRGRGKPRLGRRNKHLLPCVKRVGKFSSVQGKIRAKNTVFTFLACEIVPKILRCLSIAFPE